MKMRYSIWGREYGADHDVELAQVQDNPQPVLDGLKRKSLKIGAAPHRRTIPKYTWLRIVDNAAGRA